MGKACLLHRPGNKSFTQQMMSAPRRWRCSRRPGATQWQQASARLLAPGDSHSCRVKPDEEAPRPRLRVTEPPLPKQCRTPTEGCDF